MIPDSQATSPLAGSLTLSAAPDTEKGGAPPPLDEARQAWLVKAAADGDENAFGELIRIHGRRLYAIAYGVLQNQTEAEDVVQDTFVKAHTELGRFREAEKFGGWLNLVTRNRARDLLRRRRPQAEESEMEQLVDTGVKRPGIRMDEEHVQKQLKRALASLPEHHRMAVTLKYLEGLDHQGIEDVMGLTNGALRGMLGRALATLRVKLQLLERSSV